MRLTECKLHSSLDAGVSRTFPPPILGVVEAVRQVRLWPDQYLWHVWAYRSPDSNPPIFCYCLMDALMHYLCNDVITGLTNQL